MTSKYNNMYTTQRFQSTVKTYSPTGFNQSKQKCVFLTNQEQNRTHTRVFTRLALVACFPSQCTGYILWPRVLIGSLLFAFALIVNVSLP